ASVSYTARDLPIHRARPATFAPPCSLGAGAVGRARRSRRLYGAVAPRHNAPMLGRVLILSASAGAGHVRAAQALERAFAQLGAAHEVHHVDTLQLTNKVFRTLYSKAYIELVDRAPDVLGWLYDWLDTPWEKERRRLAWDKLNTRPFVRMLEKHRPDLVLCTHFLPAELISWLKDTARLPCPQALAPSRQDRGRVRAQPGAPAAARRARRRACRGIEHARRRRLHDGHGRVHVGGGHPGRQARRPHHERGAREAAAAGHRQPHPGPGG